VGIVSLSDCGIYCVNCEHGLEREAKEGEEVNTAGGGEEEGT
jgi:hypothetical protein